MPPTLNFLQQCAYCHSFFSRRKVFLVTCRIDLGTSAAYTGGNSTAQNFCPICKGGIIAHVPSADTDRLSPAELLARLRTGDLRALARAISTVEDRTEGAAELLAACRATPGTALRIGITGPPGAGKSTLVDRLVHAFRDQGKTVAVLAVDPSSP